MGLRETLADLIAASEKERQRREDDSTDPGAKPRLYRAANGDKSVGWYIGDREKRALLSKESLEAQLDLLFKA
jgi:hypothetical protein